MNSLFDAYIHEEEDVVACFGRRARDLFKADLPPASLPDTLVREIHQYNVDIGNPVHFTGKEALIVTGQQPGLLMGPLYSVYKILTAIWLACRIQQTRGIPCRAVFWLATEDHDFDEVRETHILTRKYEPLTLSYTPGIDVTDYPIYGIPAEDSLHSHIDQVVAHVRGSELADDIGAFFHGSLDAASSFTDWTARLFARLFRDMGLILFAPHLPEARSLAREVYRREIEHPLATAAEVTAGGQRIAQMGYPVQMVKRARSCGFFVEVDKRRHPVSFEDTFRIRGVDRELSHNEMTHMIDYEPERFSPNAALRPVVQQYLLNPSACVVGPGETAYWAQLGDVFARHKMNFPVIYPRVRCVLINTKLHAWMQQYDLERADLFEPRDVLIRQLLKREPNPDIERVFATPHDLLEQAFDTLLESLYKENPVPKKMTERLRDRTMQKLYHIENVMRRQNTEHVQVLENRLERLCNALIPWRRPQERVYTVTSFLFEHGWDFVPSLFEKLNYMSFEINEVTL